MNEPQALRRLELLERRHLDAAIPGEGECSLGGRALNVECRLERRTAALDGAVGLSLDESAHPDSESSRRRVAFYRTVLQAGSVQSRCDAVRERDRQRQQGLRRQFLGADLDQEIPVPVHHGTFPDRTVLEKGTFSFSADRLNACEHLST